MNPQDWLPKQRQLYTPVIPDIEITASCHPVSGIWRDDSQHLKSRYSWGGGASEEALKQLEFEVEEGLTQVAVLTFSPVQLFLAGGNRLRDWAVGSWLCHYLTAAIIYRWEAELGGKVLLPLTHNCELLDWMFEQKSSYEGDRFWQSSLPNVITGLLPAQDNWQKTSKQIVVEEWTKFIRRLETAVVHHPHYNRLFYGVGWQVIKKDCQHLWSVYSAMESFEFSNISQAIAVTHQTIEAKKQGRDWQKLWWGGRTSPSAGQLSIWHQGLKPVDTEKNQGLWGLPERIIDQWCSDLADARRNKLAGVFSYSDRLNSIEMVKRLASVPELMDQTLKLIWQQNNAPPCPWDRFPDRTATSAVWITNAVAKKFWNKHIAQWKRKIPYRVRNSAWGIKQIDKYYPPFLHPRVLERRNICDRPKLTDADREKLDRWRETIPPDWACTVEWTVGWRGDGDDMGSWLSGEQYQTLELPWSQWHPNAENIPPQAHRQLDLPHQLDLCVLFEKWNELLYRLTEETHLGRVIFAGGDDFLLLGSLPDAVTLTSNLHRLWTGEDTSFTEATQSEGWVKLFPDSDRDRYEIYPVPGTIMTFSLGVVIAQRRIPQSLWHRGLEQAYQEAKQAGKNRVCVKVLFNSGQSFNWICPWSLWDLLMLVEPTNSADSALNRWQKLLNYFDSTLIGKGYQLETATIIERLWQSVGIPLTWDQVEQAAGMEPEIEDWEWWKTWISLRCFLTRQKRERDQWQQKVNPGIPLSQGVNQS